MQQVLFNGDGVVFSVDGVVIFTQFTPITIQIQCGNPAEVIGSAVRSELQYNICTFVVLAGRRSNIIQLAGDRTV